MANQWNRNFKDYVKNPDLFRTEVEDFKTADLAAGAKGQEPPELVAVMLSRPLTYAELQKLKAAGEKAVPVLQDALRQERFLLHRYNSSMLTDSPMKTILDLLELFGLPESRLLDAALRHPDEYFRFNALYYLARCGNDDSVQVLKAGLTSESEQCRTYTLMGLQFLKDSPRGSPTFRAAMFEAVVPLLKDQEYGPAEHAPRALLVLDRPRAELVLLGSDIFYAGNSRIKDILNAIKDADVAVSGPKIRDLLAKIKGRATTYPLEYAYADGLVLLARAEGPGAADVIADAQLWGNAKVKAGAAIAAEIAAGVRDPYQYVYGIYTIKGIEGLSKPQFCYLTMSWLDAEVRNGGFSQFFFNSSGELAPHAVEAARTVGASLLAGIIQKANALFAEGGPDPNRDKRMDQLSRIDHEALGQLDTQYYACADRVDELLPLFVARNLEAFKPVS